MRVQPHTFRSADLAGGDVVLDLVNTVTARDADPIDWLDGYPRVLEWATLTGHFDASVLAELQRLDESEPHAGTLAVSGLRELREAAHDVLVATIRGEAVPGHALDRLESFWKEAASLSRVTSSGRLELDVHSSRLHYIAHQLALDAIELLRDLPLERTRICAGTNCGWLFIDRSKGGRRRWCDMATCGNAAKSRRHYQRKRAAKRS